MQTDRRNPTKKTSLAVSYARGAARILDPFGTLSAVRSGFAADRKALASDWRRVGIQIQDALDAYKKLTAAE
jgi:hypothetical protein